MSSTLYRNASGLPNDEQLTTAHDLTILGRTLEERFPRYFHYFSTAEFHYDGEIIGNHNHLLGRVDGVDGIKTGYTRASGFNLLTSVHRDGRSLIAVVMGGRSAGGRDRIMEDLIGDHLAEASTARTATMIADATPAATAEPSDEPAAAPPARERPAGGRGQDLTRFPATSAENAAGEGDDGAGDEEVPAQQPMLKAPAAAPRAAQPTAADLGLLKSPARAKPSAKTQARLAAASALVMPPLGRPSPVEDRRRSAQRFPAGRGQRRSRRARKLDDPGRRRRQSRQGQRPFVPRPRTKPLDPRLGQAGHGKGAQRRRHPLSRALRRPRFSLGRSGVPFAQAQWIFLLHRPRLTRILAEPV